MIILGFVWSRCVAIRFLSKQKNLMSAQNVWRALANFDQVEGVHAVNLVKVRNLKGLPVSMANPLRTRGCGIFASLLKSGPQGHGSFRFSCKTCTCAASEPPMLLGFQALARVPNISLKTGLVGILGCFRRVSVLHAFGTGCREVCPVKPLRRLASRPVPDRLASSHRLPLRCQT